MGFKREMKRMFCSDCDKETKCEREVKQVNHILHLLIIIIFRIVALPMAFVWFIIWFLLSISGSKEKFQCSTCGSYKVKSLKGEYPYAQIIVGTLLAVFALVVFTMDDAREQKTVPLTKEQLEQQKIYNEKQKELRELKVKKAMELESKKQEEFLQNIVKNKVTSKNFDYLKEEKQVVSYKFDKGDLIIFMDRYKYENMNGYREYLSLDLNSNKVNDYVSKILIYSSKEDIPKQIGSFNNKRNNKFLK